MQYFLYDLYDSLLYFFESPEWERTFFYIKLISATMSVLFGIVIVTLIVKTEILAIAIRRVMRGTEVPSFPKGKIQKKWEKILARLEARDEANLKLAVIEADNLIDSLIQKIGYKGKTSSERLKQIKPAQLKNLDELWQAHKLRNRIVHEEDFKLKLHQAEETVKNYEKVLEELEAI